MRYANLGQALRLQAERLGPRPALRYRRLGLYHDISWDRYYAEARAAALALIAAGVAVGDRVGLLAENSADWLIADMAILLAGAVNVPPHAPLTAAQVHYQLHDADVVWVIASNRGQLDKIRAVRRDLPAVRGVVVFDPAASAADAIAWDAFRRQGRDSGLDAELARREALLTHADLATVMYTSGTTGNPKGVMLTHGNLLSNALSSRELQPHGPDALILSWLPYTHIYARTCDHYLALVGGTTLALAESGETLVENLAETQPTHLASVPRFYEKVLAAVASPDPAETGKRLKRIFGPRIDWMSSGGAPLPVPIAEAFEAAGLRLMQGYGLTETSPVISFNTKTHYKLGTVGRAIPGVEVAIAADGEVLTRGPHVMPGYWKNPEATAETIHDGWLYTGDLGSLDADGFLSITGRKKELMVLSNGKKVVPSYLEGLLISDPHLDQAVVCGEGRNFLTALLVPNWGAVKATLGVDGTPEALAADGRVVEFLHERCRDRLAGLSRMEQVKMVVVLAKPFSIEAEELTVSLKLRRNVIQAHNAERLEALYRGDTSVE